jgi:hypothetical protein
MLAINTFLGLYAKLSAMPNDYDLANSFTRENAQRRKSAALLFSVG